MIFTFTNILLTIIALALSVIAIKITFSFNINDHLKRRDEKLISKMKNHCTHANVMEVNEKDSQIGIQSAFISPPGTVNWICQKCGLEIYHLDKNTEAERCRKLLQDPEKYLKQEKQFEKLLKKAGLL